MAQPKNLKKLTRARMDRTGESYTTARKAILSAKPHRPASAQDAADAAAAAQEAELPEYPAPANVLQYDAGLWHRVLTQAGVKHPLTGEPMSEALLAGLAGGIGFMVFTFVYEETTTATIVTRAHPEPYTANLLARSGAKVMERTTGSARLAADYLDAGLDAGRAVVVRASVAALPWIDADAVEESDSIDLVVVGEHGEDLLVDDGSGSLTPISPEDLAAARSRRKKDKHWQAWIPERTGPDAAALAASVREAIAQTTGRLLGTSELEGIPAHFAKNFGVAGMNNWAERLRDATTKKGWTRIFEDPARLESGLNQILGFLTDTRFGGVGALRGQYADFLAEASGLPGLAALGAHAADYAHLAQDWIVFTDLVDPQIEVQDRTGHFAVLADQLEVIAAGEERAARALADTLGTLAD
ncbi:DUF4872 domain-containing protein [Paeniglutamicibacter psychrophenolicus]|uniref:DUF4872 domain-containing protein n=1 Tax=Paeniglutamicibacter psychrophenolicus TaxID=257454 RepID=UPI00277FA7F3|nr:DUF4872 domain-containing protein [Paeniglutamicibacter psychrophenolicus]MDQ0094595.1 hypothetical protein [Paeniglutamicibacter psychrophenolicus]